MEAFIDSFKHPDSFIYLNNEKIHCIDTEGGYIILEQPSYKGFSIGEGDCILYQNEKDSMQQNTVSYINSDDGRKTYYTTSYSDVNNGPIYDHQIIGKIIGKSGDNIWITLCLRFWDISIDHLNIFGLFSDE